MALHAFSRTELLVGADALERLKHVRIAVFGIGGVGGYAVEALARSGVGAIDLIDDDRICLTNLNRQLHALRNTIGKYKVDVAKERILQIHPDCQVQVHHMFYMPETADQLDFSAYDYLIDAVDTVTAKIDLAVRANQLHIPIISAMGAGNKMDPTAFEVTDIYETSVCPLARVIRYELFQRKTDCSKGRYGSVLSNQLRLSARNCKKMYAAKSHSRQQCFCSFCSWADSCR